MTFTRTRSLLMFSYHIQDPIISRCYGFTNDLGFKLYSNLDPGLHIEMASCKALRMLGIIMRLSKDLNLTSSLKVLYCSLVRPIIEYGAIIWDPHTADNACQVERVQLSSCDSLASFQASNVHRMTIPQLLFNLI